MPNKSNKFPIDNNNSLLLLNALFERTNNLKDVMSLEQINWHFKMVNSYSLAEHYILKILLQRLGFTIVAVNELKLIVKGIKLKRPTGSKKFDEDQIDFSKIFIITNDYSHFIRRSDISEALIKLGYRNSEANIQNAEKYLWIHNCIRRRAHRGCDIYRNVMFVV